MDYEHVASFAKYGGTLFFFVFFVIVLIYVLYPGGGKRAKEAAEVLFQEDKPRVDHLADNSDLGEQS